MSIFVSLSIFLYAVCFSTVAEVPVKFQSNQTQISRLRYFTRSYNKTSYQILKLGPGYLYPSAAIVKNHRIHSNKPTESYVVIQKYHESMIWPWNKFNSTKGWRKSQYIVKDHFAVKWRHKYTLYNIKQKWYATTHHQNAIPVTLQTRFNIDPPQNIYQHFLVMRNNIMHYQLQTPDITFPQKNQEY